MKFFSKKDTKKKETVKLPMSRKTKRALVAYAGAVLCMTCFTTTAFAANDPITVVNNPVSYTHLTLPTTERV